MNKSNQKGNVLLFIILAMTVLSVLGTGVYFLTTTSTFSGLEANAQQRGYQLAVTGRDYALAKNLPNMDRTFTMANADKFRLQIVGDTITSTGIVNENTPYEARHTITITKTGFGSQADISFARDIASFSPVAQTGFAAVDTTAAQISLGQLAASLFGSAWYGGDIAAGNCNQGKCDFKTGFRAFFTFRLTRQGSDIPHGFTFTVFNGADNSNISSGGDVGMPELLAYGGNSCIEGTGFGCTSHLVADASKRGIHPPKIGIEFDGRTNTGYDVVCPPWDRADSLSREDGLRTHMAYVFWGNNTTACGNRDNSRTYDDNRHGTGTADDPVNAVSTDAADEADYFVGLTPSWAANWLYGTTNVHAVRIEITRATTLNGNGKYSYTLKTWLKRCDSTNIGDPTACSEFPGLSNTKVAYDPAADAPTLNRTVELTPAFHTKFDKFLFGWTAAAGAASRENVTLSNFQLYFEK